MTTELSTSGPAARRSPIPPNTAYALLCDEQRRYLLAHLADAVGAITLETAADAIATRLGDRSPARREHLLAELHHVHVPMLAEAAVITYDHERHVLESCPRAASLEPYLEAAGHGADSPIR